LNKYKQHLGVGELTFSMQSEPQDPLYVLKKTFKLDNLSHNNIDKLCEEQNLYTLQNSNKNWARLESELYLHPVQ
jgi:hypothetical protein